MMSERLFEFDPEQELVEAFECFDENDSGLVKVEEMRKWLSELGDRMDDREVCCLMPFNTGNETDCCRLTGCLRDRLRIGRVTLIIVNGSRFFG